MANSTVILYGSLFILSILSGSLALLGTNHIGPFKSDIQYLEDFCTLPDGVSINVRGIKDTDTSGNDHDHDSDRGFEMVYEKIDNLIGKGIRRVNKFMEIQKNYNEKYRNMFLDTSEQPSINIKLFRPGHKKLAKLHKKILKKLQIKEPIRCRIMMKLKKAQDKLEEKLGTVINFLNAHKKSWQNDYRLRIIASNLNMTQYWIEGRQLIQDVIMAQKENDKFPIAIDLATDPNISVSLQERQDMENMMKEDQDFLILEMQTINDNKAPVIKQKEHEDDDETEMIVNVYKTTHRYVIVEKDGNLKNDDGTQKLKTVPVKESDLEKLPINATVEIINECPKGTFDCFANGLQCIPNYLRCNGEDNCGNNFDEIFQCSSISMYYVMGIDPYRTDQEIFHQSFWLAVKFLLLIIMTCLALYLIVGLFKCCCTCQRRRGYLVDGRTPMVYFNKAATRSNSLLKQPLLSAQTENDAIRAPSPPPSYFGSSGNGLDNKASTINEYIYVNNNYGQPQGGTCVRTNVSPPSHRDNNTGEASAPPSYQNMYPTFPNFSTPSNYGGTQKQ